MSNAEPSFPLARLRAMQIIAAALILGAVAFAGIALYIVVVENEGRAQAAGPAPLISFFAAGLLLLNAPLAFSLPGIVTRNGLRQLATGTAPAGDDMLSLLTLRQTSMIVGLALLEAVAFMSLIAFILEAVPLVLLVAASAVLLMLVQFPTLTRVRAWLELQSARLQELREERQRFG